MASVATPRFADRNLGPVARAAGAVHDDVHVSFEFFPPKNDRMEAALWKSIQKLEPLNPDFVSVTYGAGGSTRERTHRTVTRMVQETKFKPAAHLTCVGSRQEEIKGIADAYWDDGVRHIVALRGDPQTGIGDKYSPTKGGFAYSSDLVAGLKSYHDFEVSVSAYPERHPESQSWDVEIDNLKKKSGCRCEPRYHSVLLLRRIPSSASKTGFWMRVLIFPLFPA